MRRRNSWALTAPIRARIERGQAPATCSNCATAATAMTSGDLPLMPGRPIGQVMRVSSSGAMLWTQDKRLNSAAQQLGIDCADSGAD